MPTSPTRTSLATTLTSPVRRLLSAREAGWPAHAPTDQPTGPLGRLHQALAPHLMVLTRAGRTGIVGAFISLALLLAGGWQEALTVMVVLALCYAVALAWMLPRGGHHVEHALMEPRVTVGDRAVIHVTVTNPTHRLLMPVRMEMGVGSGRAVFVVPGLVPGAAHERGFVLPTRRRGVVTVGPVHTVLQDPLGLLRREQVRTEQQSIHIHPRTIHLGTELQGTLRDIEGVVTEDLSSSDVSFHALRSYVAGDDRRNVHWKTTARTGRIMVRQFEETRRSNLVVLLSTRASAYADEEDFELAVSVACSLAVEALAANREVHVLTQGGPLPTTSPLRLLDASCLIQADSEVTCDDLARRASQSHPDASILALVTGQATENVLLARARILTPASVSAFTVCCGRAGVRRRHAGAMPVVDVPDLESLPHGVRAVVSA